MPLDDSLRDQILAYCTRDLPGDLNWHVDQFHFMNDEPLRKTLGRAFFAARYVAKLLEALRS